MRIYATLTRSSLETSIASEVDPPERTPQSVFQTWAGVLSFLKRISFGGHTQICADPLTGETVDYGVVVWHNLTVVESYLARLNVSVAITKVNRPGRSKHYEFQSGKLDSAYSPSNPTDALIAYEAQLAKYPYLEHGFDVPYSVSSDLLLPFGEFTKKYELQATVDLTFGFTEGLGDMLAHPTLYVMKLFGPTLIKELSTGFLTTALHDNSLLYEHARADLGQNALLNSSILVVDRKEEQKFLSSHHQGLILIKALKLIFTIPPKLDNLHGRDLSEYERALFKQFSNFVYCTGLIRNTGIPANVSVVNVGLNTLHSVPVLPWLYSIIPTIISGLLNLKFGSVQEIPDGDVTEAVVSSVQRLETAGKGSSHPEFAAYSGHTSVRADCSANCNCMRLLQESLRTPRRQTHILHWCILPSA